MNKKESSKKNNVLDFVMNCFIKVLIIVAFVIIIGILISLYIYYIKSQDHFSKNFIYVLTLLKESLSCEPKNLDTSEVENILTLRMQYINKLNEIHIQATSNNLIIFLYGFLSSVLIGTSAYLLKREQDNINNLTKQFDSIDKKNEEIKDEYKKLEEQYNLINNCVEELNKKNINISEQYKIINDKAKVIEDKASDIENDINKTVNIVNLYIDKINYQYITQILSDALTSIMCYNIGLVSKNLVQFKRSIHQVSLCLIKNEIDLSKIGKLYIDTFLQQLESIKVLYEAAAEKEDTEISEFHKKYIYEDFKQIEKALEKR
jgi:cell division protein FtsB